MKIYFKQRTFKDNSKEFISQCVLRISFDLNFKALPNFDYHKDENFLGMDFYWLFFQVTFLKKYENFKSILE